jgi:hypothetical protein
LLLFLFVVTLFFSIPQIKPYFMSWLPTKLEPEPILLAAPLARLNSSHPPAGSARHQLTALRAVPAGGADQPTPWDAEAGSCWFGGS